jgi:hypothetical protein
MAEGEVRECAASDQPGEPDLADLLDEDEKRELFGADLQRDSDPTLVGNRIAALAKRLGFPPCRGCEFRQAWLNRAHGLLRQFGETIGGS